MKIRQGFVSNSSSSSFIVKWKEQSDFVKKTSDTKLTKEQVELLKSNGFVIKNYCSVHQADNKTEKLYNKTDASFYKEVICNQEDVILFLLQNKIPFEASIHYNNWGVVYFGGKYMYELKNCAETYSMMGRDKYNEKSIKAVCSNPLKKILVSKFIIDNTEKDDKMPLEYEN